MPDQSKLLKFVSLLEQRKLTKALLVGSNARLAECGPRRRKAKMEGTAMIAVPPSPKEEALEYSPEMHLHQTGKGIEWSCTRSVHIEACAGFGPVSHAHQNDQQLRCRPH